jgi:Papain family cysteine protease
MARFSNTRWSGSRRPSAQPRLQRPGRSNPQEIARACAFALRVFVLVGTFSVAAAQANSAPLPPRVDLRPDQTPIRDQGGRGTCIVHSVVAAMEAALKRSGRDVDLSEDTFMLLIKQFWLADINRKPANTAENQVTGFDGGGAVENMYFLANGMAIPEESTGHRDGYQYKCPFPWDHVHWKSQFVVDSWNLSPRRTLPSTMRARRYFAIGGFKQLSNPKDPAGIERALQERHEVIWGFPCGGKRPDKGVWHYAGPAKPEDGGHSILIVGYDRTNPKAPYFIVKNSWGPTKIPGADGFTYIGYDYLKYGTEAAYLTTVKQVSWPELRFVGRWEVTFDGWKGILDVSHLPGIFRGVFKQNNDRSIDRRIGTFYDKNDPKKALRVNGEIKGNRIDFYVDWSNPNPGLDKRGGRHFTYYLAKGDSDLMAGSHRDPEGTEWGGFARRLKSDEAFPGDARVIDAARLPEMASLAPSTRLQSEPKPESYLGDWTLYCQSTPITVHLTERDDSVVPRGRQAACNGLRGEGVTALVDKQDRRKLELTVSSPETLRPAISFHGLLLSRERGIVAGTAQGGKLPRNSRFGAVLVRKSDESHIVVRQ